MVDLEEMKKWAEHLGEGEPAGSDMETVSRLLHNAATELVERRREPVAQGPSVEERRLYWLGVFAPLVWSNCAKDGIKHIAMAARIVNMTDAMLAAERAPTYPEVKP